MQNIRQHRRRLRQFVWVALFIWVFSLTVGVANACLVSMPGSASPGDNEQPHTHAANEDIEHDIALTESTDHGSTAHARHEHTDGTPQGGASKAGCLKFCDDQSSAISKSGNPGFDQMPAHVSMDGFKIRPAPVTQAARRLPLEQPNAQGPPLVIRLLRLTL